MFVDEEKLIPAKGLKRYTSVREHYFVVKDEEKLIPAKGLKPIATLPTGNAPAKDEEKLIPAKGLKLKYPRSPRAQTIRMKRS